MVKSSTSESQTKTPLNIDLSLDNIRFNSSGALLIEEELAVKTTSDIFKALNGFPTGIAKSFLMTAISMIDSAKNNTSISLSD